MNIGLPAEQAVAQTSPEQIIDDEEKKVGEETLVSTNDRVKWLQEQAFQKTNDIHQSKSNEVLSFSNELTADKVKWLQEQAFNKAETNDAGEGPAVSNELTSDKVKWLQEQAFNKAKQNAAEEGPAVSKELTSDRVKWLQEQAFIKAKTNDAEEGPAVSSELTSDKVKWLQEQAFNKAKTNDAGEGPAVSNELTTDRVKWLQGLAAKDSQKSKNMKEEAGVAVSHELTADRVKWLQEQAFNKAKNNPAEEGPVASNELTSDKVKWLQEQAFIKAETNDAEEGPAVSNELTSDKVKWLQEQAFIKAKTNDAGEGPAVSNELTSDKVKWLQEQAFNKAKTNDAGEGPAVSSELTSDKVKWLQEQAFKNDNILPIKQKHDDDSHSANESESESESEPEDSFTDAADMPEGNDTDDLYALLAYSKGRVQDRKLDVSTEENDQLDQNNVSSNRDDQELQDDALDDDLSEESSVSHESIDGLMDDYDDAVEETENASIPTHTVSLASDSHSNVDASSTPIAGNHGEKIATSTRDYRKQQKKKETDELWALLNYSKVRLATGATPTVDEAKALGMSHDSEVLESDDSDNEAQHKNVNVNVNVPQAQEGKHGNDKDSDDDGSLDSDASDESSLGDDELNMSIEINHEEIAASRARALAALARTNDVYGGMYDDDDVETNLNSIANSQSPRGAMTLTEQQMLKSIALAEEESLRGASEFSTRKKLSILDKVRTPKKFGRGRGGNMDRDVTAEVSSFKEKARSFWNVSKKKAEQAMKDIRTNVAKVEKQTQNHTPNNNSVNAGLPSAGIRLKDDSPFRNEASPFKRFSTNIAKVEKMNDEKYGNSVHFV